MRIQFTFCSKKSPSASQRLHVVLGSCTVKAFVVAPKSFHVMGIVRIGMEFGLLARNATGNYVRINGSDIQVLNNLEVEDAIYRTKRFGRGESYAASRAAAFAQRSPGAATVIRKKHRKIDPSHAANHHFPASAQGAWPTRYR
jgi:hypothetical protein